MKRFGKIAAMQINTSSSTSPIHLNIEVADNWLKINQGLMSRDSLDVDSGMLFIFNFPHLLSFWMRNSVIPLDIIFIDEYSKVAHIAKNTDPGSTESISSTVSCQFALEVNAGFASKNDIKVGDKVFWQYNEVKTEQVA